MTDTQEALLAGIIEAPLDDAPRLIYADYLEEHGEENRAEYIRISVELDRMEREHQPAYILHQAFTRGDNIALNQVDWEPIEPTLHRYCFIIQRLEKLRDDYFHDWLRDDELLNLGLRWSGGKRGFAERATIAAPVKASKNAHKICSRTPLTSIEFCSRIADHHLVRMINSGLLNRIVQIENLVDDFFLLELLADTPAVNTLQEYENINATELQALVHHPEYRAFKKLDLRLQTVDPDLFQAFLRAPHLKSIEELTFGSNAWHSEFLADFIQQDWSNLRVLSLNNCKIDDEALELLVTCPTLTNLHTLYLDDNRFTETGFSALLASKNLQNLKCLSVDSNEISGFSKRAIVNSKLRLWVFSASNCRLLPSDLRNLAESELFRELIWLCLGSCSITDGGLKNLLKSPFERLTVTNLMNNRFVNSGVQALCETSKLSTLQRCHLVNNPIDEQGALALAQSNILRDLKHICLSCAELDHLVRNALENRFKQVINLL